MNNTHSIRVEALEHWPAVLMVWSTHVENQDIRPAFQSLLKFLAHSQQPLYLLVDLSENVTMPLSETINNALMGAYTHPNLLACLVFGGHSRAKIAGNIVQRISHEYKIHWFKTETDAYEFLKGKVAGNGA